MGTHQKNTTENKWTAHVYLAEGHPRPLAIVRYDAGGTVHYDFEGCQVKHLFDAQLSAESYAGMLNRQKATPNDVKTKMAAEELPKGRFATDKEIANDREKQKKNLKERISLAKAAKERTITKAQQKRLDQILQEMVADITGNAAPTAVPVKKSPRKIFKP